MTHESTKNQEKCPIFNFGLDAIFAYFFTTHESYVYDSYIFENNQLQCTQESMSHY